MALTILAQITAVAGSEDLVRTQLEKLVSITRAEQGCLQYDLHIDNENPGFFVFYENWESRELWQQHMSAPHLAAYMEATDGAVANFSVNELSKIACYNTAIFCGDGE
ncbi:putative quinol monooxygenase [Ahrensia kielensis]|uniref:Quinol monooxygenase n=1 Tax=Ahrensia kielensis TaxID=76980 RepID=A0ABU9T3E6_9HYPH